MTTPPTDIAYIASIELEYIIPHRHPGRLPNNTAPASPSSSASYFPHSTDISLATVAPTIKSPPPEFHDLATSPDKLPSYNLKQYEGALPLPKDNDEAWLIANEISTRILREARAKYRY